jgi:VAD1 Analog of StAR-related lipid transfer domain
MMIGVASVPFAEQEYPSGYAENFETNLTASAEEQTDQGRTSSFFKRKVPMKQKGPLHVHVNYEQSLIATPIQHRRVFSTGDLPNARENIPDTEEALLLSPASDSLVHWLSPSTDDENTTATIFQLPALPVLDTSCSDDSSVGSAAYFDPSDFDTSTWKRVLNDASVMGLAVVALATVIAHPLLFIAGAVTALGTATAAHRGYDYYANEGNSSSSWRTWFCFDLSFLGNNHHEEIELMDESSTAALEAIPTITNESKTIQKSDDATVECSSSTGTHEDRAVPLEIPPIPSRRELSLSKADQQDWLERYYPPLTNIVVKGGGAFVGLNTMEFFHVFFDDDAPYNFRVFQEKRGDIDIHYGSWEPLPTVGAVSMFPSVSTDTLDFPSDISYRSFQCRTLTFKAKTNSFFGPPYATTTKTQRFLIVNKRLAILESRTVLSDIPFSERFFVKERWVITAGKVEKRYVTHVTASCEAAFNQSCPFESQIKTKSTSTISDVVTSWCKMATEAIKLTEKAKLDRLQRTLDEDDETDFDDDFLTDIADANPAAAANTANSLAKHRRVCSDDGVEIVADVVGSHQQAACDSDESYGLSGETHFVLMAPSRTQQLMLPSRRNPTRLPKLFGKRRSFDDECTKASI